MTRIYHAVAVACLLVLTALCAGGVLSPPAHAAPPDIMGLPELSTLLQSGPLTGYLKTTLNGYTPKQIPVKVDGIMEDPSGDLILFEASGPEIDRLGSIAEGMSGSPIYVNDGTTDRLIGALSYGSEFTTGGMGLATPIESMVAIQEAYSAPKLAAAPAPGEYPLARAVKTSEGTLSRVVIARDGDAAAKLSASPGEVVMKPLGLIEIGGVRPGSHAYKDLAARLGQSGLDVRPASGGGHYEGPAAPALQAGSPCCVLYSEGDDWYGAAGTVTYVDGDDVMVFGHPLEWLGETDAIFTAGYVDGSWPNSYAPYLMISPRNEVGTVTQDRYCGVLADLSREPDLVPVTVHATYPVEGREVTKVANVAGGLIQAPAWCTLPADVVMDGLTATNDAFMYPGSADVTTTVTVHDASGSYTVTRHNLWDSPDDVAMDAASDPASVLDSLVDDPDGVVHPHVDTIGVEATVSPARRSARIASVTLPQGLRTGDNPIVVRYYKYGSADLQQLEGVLTIPKGVRLDGELDVYPGVWQAYGYGFGDWESGGGEADATPPKTLAQLVQQIQASPANSDLLVSFSQNGSDEGPDGPSDGQSGPAAQAVIPTDSVFSNEFYQSTISIQMEALPRTVPYGGMARVMGAVEQVTGDTPVRLYRVDAGSDTEVYLKTVKATYQEGSAEFQATVSGLTHTCRIVARCDGTATALPGYGSAQVKVAALVLATASAKGGKGTFTVRLLPRDATGKLVVQRRVGHAWSAWRTRTLDGSSGAVKFALGRGSYVLRARFAGGALCAAGVSNTVKVTVR